MQLHLVTVLALVLTASCTVTDRARGNLYDALTPRRLSVFKHALWDFEYIYNLVRKNRNLTLFAPTNTAFLNLIDSLGHKEDLNSTTVKGEHVLDILENYNIDLPALLEYHIIKRIVDIPTLKSGNKVETNLKNKTFEWDKLAHKIKHNDPIRPYARVFRQGNIEADNGLIHVIDAVLIPYSYGIVTIRTAPGDPVELDPVELDPDTTLEPSSGPSINSPRETDSSPRSSSDEESLCFPASAKIMLKDGNSVRMDQLQVGMHIRTDLHTQASSKVLLFSHKVHTKRYSFIRIQTERGNAITISPTHYLWTDGRLTTARAVQIGNELQTIHGSQRVVRINRVSAIGAVAPHTVHGDDLIVDGILASSYTNALHPRFASLLLAPLRYAARFGWVDDPLGNILHNGAPRLLSLIPQAPEVL